MYLNLKHIVPIYKCFYVIKLYGFITGTYQPFLNLKLIKPSLFDESEITNSKTHVFGLTIVFKLRTVESPTPGFKRLYFRVREGTGFASRISSLVLTVTLMVSPPIPTFVRAGFVIFSYVQYY